MSRPLIPFGWSSDVGREDDWKGIIDPQERKRRQNRINQRAYRRKHGTTKLATSQARGDGTQSSTLFGPSGNQTLDNYINGAVLLTCPRLIEQYRQAAKEAYEAYNLRTIRPNSLPILIRLNVLDALVRNARLMGFAPEGLCSDDYCSPFSEIGPRLSHSPMILESCPELLQPTTIQRKIVHHPWSDLLPFPSFREEILQAVEAEALDEDQLCVDIFDLNGTDLGEKPALIVWGQSSAPSTWEASAAFFRKYGWLVWNCPELLESTNRWRAQRGEGQIQLPEMKDWKLSTQDDARVEAVL